MTGHSMQSDWAVILVASVPLVIVVAYIVMDTFPKISAEVGGIKVSLEKAMDFSKSEMIQFNYQLADSFLETGDLENLNEHLEQLRVSKKSPSMLLVPMAKNVSGIFPGLKQYVYELAKIPSMQFIVFVDMNRTYLGFMPISSFIAKYPKTSLEIILDDMIKDENSAKYWANTFQLNSHIDLEILKRDFIKLAAKQWMGEIEDLNDRQRVELERSVFLKQLSGQKPNSDKSRIRELEFIRQERGGDRQLMDLVSDVLNLGAMTAHISRNEEPSSAYNLMSDYGVSGLPVLDENHRFLGMFMKEELFDQLMRHFLAATEKGQKS